MTGMPPPCQPIGCDNGYHIPGCELDTMDGDSMTGIDRTWSVGRDPAPAHLPAYLGFDLETTGVDVDTARIVSGAAVLDYADRGRPPVEITRTWLAAVEVPKEAEAIHGIGTAYAMEFGRPEHVVVGQIIGALLTAFRRGVPIVGMNLAYDLTLLDRRATALGLDTLCGLTGDKLCSDGPVIDIYVIDKMRDPYRPGKRKLADLVEHHLGHPMVGAHDAVADVKASIAIARKLATGHAGTDAFFHRTQRMRRRHQQDSLQEYFRAQGDDDAVCDPCWPVCHPGFCPRRVAGAPGAPSALTPGGNLLSWDDV